MNIRLKSILKWMVRMVIYFIVLVFLLFAVLRIPVIQTKIAKIATNSISKKIDAEISISKVAINFIDNVKLKGLYIEDQLGDTLFFAEQLNVDIGLFKLIQKTIDIEKIVLNNSVINVHQQSDKNFSFQFIIDAFEPKNPKPDKKSSSFKFDIGELQFNGGDYSFDLLNAKNELTFDLLHVKTKTLNFSELIFDVSSISLSNIVATSYWDEMGEKDAKDFDEQSKEFIFPFKGFPAMIKCDALSIDGRGIYEVGDSENKDYFHYKYIHANKIDIQLNNIVLDSTESKVEVNMISTQLNEQFQLNKLRTKILFTSSEISLEKLEVATSESAIYLSAATRYTSFNELLNLDKATKADLQIDSFQVQPAELAYFVPQLQDIEILKTMMDVPVELTANLNGSLNQINIDDFHLKLAQTDLKLNGSVSDVLDYKNLALKDVNLTTSTNINDLRYILGSKIIKPEYDHFGDIELITGLSGDLNNLSMHQMELKTQGQLSLNATGEVQNLLAVDELSYNLEIKEIITGYEDAQVFADSLPKMLAHFAEITYQGKLKGDINTYDLTGALNTSLGAVQTDLFIDFNDQFNNASYKGAVILDEFQLGKFLSNDSIGNITMHASLDGKGLSIDSINTVLQATVEHIEFNNYDYKDIEIDGRFVQRQFNGKAGIADENLTFDFEGLVDFNDSLPKLDFEATLNAFDAKELNLTDFPLQAQFNVSSDITGLSLDLISGNLKITDLLLRNEEEQWKSDSIIFVARNLPDQTRAIHLDASFIEMDLIGNYKLESLTNLFLEFGNQFFPFSKLISKNDEAHAVVSNEKKSFDNEQINAKLVIKELPQIASFFKIDLQQLDSIYLTLDLNAPQSLLNFELYIPSVLYNSIYIDSLYLHTYSKNSALNSELSIDSINFFNTAYVPGISATAKFMDNEAELSTYVENDTGGYSLALQAAILGSDGQLLFSLLDPLILNTKVWNVDQSHAFIIGERQTEFPQLSINHNKEQLKFIKINKGYEVELSNFNLNNILELIEFDSTYIRGDMNGIIKMNTEDENDFISGDLKIASIKVNDIDVGNLKLLVDKTGNQAYGEVSLDGHNNDVKILADYNISDATIDGNLNMNNFYLPTVAPFLSSIVDDLEGYLSGNIDLSGSLKKLDLNGQLKFNEVSALVKAVETRYSIKEGNIQLSPEKWRPTLSLRDEEDRSAILSGSISHRYFSDFQFDLNFKSDAFTFLNSKNKEEELFYGKFVGKLNANISGGIDLPVVRGSLAALDGTDITIQLLSPKAVANQETYIVFLDGGNYSMEDIDSIANERYKIKAGIDLSMIVSIDEKATTRLIIDPLTGDNLEINGNADLTLKIPPYGDLDINGVYTVTKGFYRFSFQKLLKRKFELVSGSQISFAGKPMNARMSLKAAYQTQASAYSLIADETESLSEVEKSEVKKKKDVTVLLKVDGKMSEPRLSFDIEMPQSNSTPMGSSVSRALKRIKQNESDLNKQVFSLLLFNSFTGSQSSGNISSTGTSTAVRSVGNLINTQLNRLANKAEGFQIDFNMDQYTDQFSETGEQITEIDLGLSQTLLDDRLIISVAGNVGLESGNQDKGALTNLAGDFVLSYKISADGRYRVKVFQKSDFDALNDANVWKTGAGFSYQTKFGYLRRSKNKKKENDQIEP